jgi:hypothetical protein
MRRISSQFPFNGQRSRWDDFLLGGESGCRATAVKQHPLVQSFASSLPAERDQCWALMVA